MPDMLEIRIYRLMGITIDLFLFIITKGNEAPIGVTL